MICAKKIGSLDSSRKILLKIRKSETPLIFRKGEFRHFKILRNISAIFFSVPKVFGSDGNILRMQLSAYHPFNWETLLDLGPREDIYSNGTIFWRAGLIERICMKAPRLHRENRTRKN